MASMGKLPNEILLPACEQNVLDPAKALIHQTKALRISGGYLLPIAHQTSTHCAVNQRIAPPKKSEPDQRHRGVIQNNGSGNKKREHQASDELHQRTNQLLCHSLALSGDLLG